MKNNLKFLIFLIFIKLNFIFNNDMNSSNIAIIGTGIGGLSTAFYLTKNFYTKILFIIF